MSVHYRQELFRTPEVLGLALAQKVVPELSGAENLVFCGCGTSFYIGGQAAGLLRASGRAARAVEAVELLDAGVSVRPGEVYVFISRSGESEETVLAMREVKAAGGLCCYLGCTGESRLGRECGVSVVAGYARETLVLESFSYYAQLLLALRACGVNGGAGSPEAVAVAMDAAERVFEGDIGARVFSRIITLAAPLYLPLAREMSLKAGEITQLPAEDWGVLEFRHGPRSWAGKDTLIHLMPGERTAEWDRKVASELLYMGCPLVYYGENAPPGAVAAPSLSGGDPAASVLAAAAFHACTSLKIAENLGREPSDLRNLVYNVEVL